MNCRFLHIKKASSAEECHDFFNSYCPRGKYCPLLHYVPSAPKRKAEEALSIVSENEAREEIVKNSEVNEEEEFEKAWELGKGLKMFI